MLLQDEKFVYTERLIEKYDTRGERICVDGQFYDIYVSYTLGGMNYFTGKVDPRGYFLHINPIQFDGTTVVYRAFTGIKKFLEPANKFSPKKLKKLADNTMADMHQNLDKYLDMLQYA